MLITYLLNETLFQYKYLDLYLRYTYLCNKTSKQGVDWILIDTRHIKTFITLRYHNVILASLLIIHHALQRYTIYTISMIIKQRGLFYFNYL